jgi:hypothetical protein
MPEQHPATGISRLFLDSAIAVADIEIVNYM